MTETINIIEQPTSMYFVLCFCIINQLIDIYYNMYEYLSISAQASDLWKNNIPIHHIYFCVKKPMGF